MVQPATVTVCELAATDVEDEVTIWASALGFGAGGAGCRCWQDTLVLQSSGLCDDELSLLERACQIHSNLRSLWVLHLHVDAEGLTKANCE